MYINQPNIPIEELTKEQISAIKQGYAYKRWKKRNFLTIFISMLWIFGGLILINIFPDESVMDYILFILYLIGIFVAIILEIRNLKVVCWTCPNCKKELLKKEIGLGKKYTQPVLALKCHHCDYDLTQKK